jgi:hypothetical protein
VGPRTGLDDMERRKVLSLQRLELRPLGNPARSQSLCRLRYPGSFYFIRLPIRRIKYMFYTDNTYVHTHIHIYIYIYIYIRTHICMYTYEYINSMFRRPVTFHLV